MSNPLPRYLAQQLDDRAYDLHETDYHSATARCLYQDAEPDALAEIVYNDALDSDFDPGPNWLGGLFLAVAFAAGWAGCYLWTTLVGGR